MVTTTDWASGCVLAQRADHVDARAVGQAEVDQRDLEAFGADERQRVVHAGGLEHLGLAGTPAGPGL